MHQNNLALNVVCHDLGFNLDFRASWEGWQGTVLFSRSWHGKFAEVCHKWRTPCFHCRKGRAAQPCVFFYWHPGSTYWGVCPCARPFLPKAEREQQVSSFAYGLQKTHDFRYFLPCCPSSRKWVLVASPRDTLLCGVILLLHSSFSGNKIEQHNRCPCVGVSMVRPELFWRKHRKP